MVGATAIKKNTQIGPDGEVQNIKTREQTMNTDTNIVGSNNQKNQLADVGTQVLAVADIINTNKQSTGGSTGGATNIDLKKQRSKFCKQLSKEKS